MGKVRMWEIHIDGCPAGLFAISRETANSIARYVGGVPVFYGAAEEVDAFERVNRTEKMMAGRMLNSKELKQRFECPYNKMISCFGTFEYQCSKCDGCAWGPNAARIRAERLEMIIGKENDDGEGDS